MKTNFYALVLLCALAIPSFGQAPVINSFTGPPAVCSSPAASSNFTVSATNSPLSYSWSVSPSASVVIGTPGAITAIGFPNTNLTYTISCMAINGSGNSAVSTLTVTVYEMPTVTLSGNNVFCQGSSTNLSASSTILYSASSALSYTWSPPTGLNTTSGPNVIASPTVTTTYTINVGLGFCVNTYQQTVSVTIPPTVTAVLSPAMICAGGSASLTIGGNAAQYFNNSVSATAGTSVVSPATSTTYTISGKTNNCQTFVTASIQVLPCPIISAISGPTAVCSFAPADIFNVSASNSPTSFVWSVSPSAGVSNNGPGGIQTISFPNTNLTYTVYCTAINAYGSSTASLQVTVFETPSVTFSGNNVFCQGSSTNFSASSTLLYSASSALSYTWSPPAGLNTTSGPNVTANPTVTTTYTINVGLGFCANTYQQTATVNIPPIVTATFQPWNICNYDDSSILTIGGNASQYFSNSLPATTGTTLVLPTINNGIVTYTISGTGNGCETSITASLNITPCVGFNSISADAIEKLSVYPNPSNGTFIVKSPRSESMMVTNELGQMIRQMDLIANEETEVRELPAGVYFIITAGGKSKLIVTR